MAKSIPAPWTGRILHVNLSTGETRLLDTTSYLRDYLGGRGLAARLAWDMIPPGMGAYDPEAPLFFMPGALVGTPAPSSGRVTICGLSPQAYPHEWYTRANLGGHWGAELKYAGYDGLVITGCASKPTLLTIQDDRVELRDAGSLWGQGLVESQVTVQQALGAEWRILAIGPAGENLCRYAIIATGTESAAGQGGFGAVMGNKRLKAIAVRGTGGVSVARPQEALRRSRLVMRRVLEAYGSAAPRDPRSDPSAGTPRPSPCTSSCPRSCGSYYHDLPGRVYPERRYSGQQFCCAPIFRGGGRRGYEFDFETGFELAQISNELGINHWEMLFGIVPWSLRLEQQGLPIVLDGERLDWSDASFWARFMHKVAHREGWGDLMAEGAPRVADRLGLGYAVVAEFYPAWGQASHWDGHGNFPSPYFPYWVVTALQWALDTRDPIGGGHGFTTNIFGLLRRLNPKPEDADVWRRFAAVGEAIYGTPEAVGLLNGYQGKAVAAVFHHDRGALKDSLGICDNIFPFLTDAQAPDYLVRVDDIEGKYLEHYMFEAISELELGREALDQVGARIYALERLLAIRNWGRSRAMDETIMRYLDFPEGGVNPYIGGKVAFNPPAFRAALDEVYRLRGWDQATGDPLPQTLQKLGLSQLLG
jgi:aldehyde:ferredoxin oxidoreductase